MKQYQAVVIGGGPGGYEAALELARGGMKTLLIERKKEHIGGTCLNEGCIPTKNYLQSAEFASKIAHFTECGLDLRYGGLDLARLAQKTVELKNEIRSGVVWLLDQAGVESLYGDASFTGPNTIDVAGETIGFNHCIIATGSKSRRSAELPIDGKRILSSREVFDLERLPKSITIVGGGPIGCEFATFFNAFGTEVTLIARSDRLVPGEDEDVSKALLRSFKKAGIRVFLSARVRGAVVDETGVSVSVEGENIELIRSEIVLSAIGRLPHTAGLFPEKAGVKLTPKGFVEVNTALQTSQPHIYATGDCIDTPAFAHTAYAEARVAARNILTGSAETNAHLTPRTIFSHPQCASCGLSESEAVKAGIAVEVKKALFKVNAKSKILGDDSGFAKILISPENGLILGAVVIGNEATEIIHELMVAIEQNIPAAELTGMIHAHPTVSEIVRYL